MPQDIPEDHKMVVTVLTTVLLQRIMDTENIIPTDDVWKHLFTAMGSGFEMGILYERTDHSKSAEQRIKDALDELGKTQQ